MKESYGKGLWPALLSLTKTPYALFCQHLRWLASISPSRPPQIPPSEKPKVVRVVRWIPDAGCEFPDADQKQNGRPFGRRTTSW